MEIQRRTREHAVETFPGERAWRWQVQLRVERFLAPMRAATVAINVVVWSIQPHAPGSMPVLAWLIIAAAILYVPLDILLVFRRHDLAARIPQGSVLLDLVLILGWVVVTGATHSPFLPLIFLGAVSAPLRLPLNRSVMVTTLYGAAFFLMAPGPQRFAALYVAIGGFILAAWAEVTLNERRSSLRDGLTGCFGRNYGLFQIEQLLQRRAFPFAVGLVDLDGFKQVNDTYGHSAGDLVLQEVARRLGASIRPGDLLVRYGGDEFLIVWPNVTPALAGQIADRIRQGVEQGRFHLRAPHASIRLTASLGVATTASPCSVDFLLQEADQQLYRAKEQRNRVAVSAEAPAGSGL